MLIHLIQIQFKFIFIMSHFYAPPPDVFATDAFIMTPYTSIPSKCTEQTIASHERYTDLEERALANYFNEVEHI